MAVALLNQPPPLPQLNALIQRDTGSFGYFDDISEERVFLPFAWMDEGVEGPSEVTGNSYHLSITHSCIAGKGRRVILTSDSVARDEMTTKPVLA